MVKLPILDLTLKFHSFQTNAHEDPSIAPTNGNSAWEGAITRPTGRREYVLAGSTSAFPAADTCQSSNRTLHEIGTSLFITKSLPHTKSSLIHLTHLPVLCLLGRQSTSEIPFSLLHRDRRSYRPAESGCRFQSSIYS